MKEVDIRSLESCPLSPNNKTPPAGIVQLLNPRLTPKLIELPFALMTIIESTQPTWAYARVLILLDAVNDF